MCRRSVAHVLTRQASISFQKAGLFTPQCRLRWPLTGFFFFHIRVAGKRKSAVELLQETKAFYVKSETVLDRKQELKNSGHLQVSQLSAPGAPPTRLLRKCTGNSSACPMQPTSPSQLQATSMTPPCCWVSCHEQDRRKSSR